MAYAGSAAVPAHAGSTAERFVLRTITDIDELDIAVQLGFQAPILVAGSAGSSAAIWAIVVPGSIRVLGPDDHSTTAGQMVQHAHHAADLITDTIGRETVLSGFEFFRVVRHAPDVNDEMRPQRTHRRRRNAGSVATGAAQPVQLAQPSIQTVADRREVVRSSAAVSWVSCKKPRLNV